jgi:putative phage-type endonuclease
MRKSDITSTEVSALFGISPYLTLFELWHHKKSQDLVEIQETERMKWGSRLEHAIATGVAEDMDWHVEPYKDYIRMPDYRIGSSFDFAIYKEGENHTTYPAALLEIKNVDSLAFKAGWVAEENGHVEAPLHIEMQVQHQMLVSGFTEAYIAALVGGNTATLIKRTADETIHHAIVAKVAAFWKSIESGDEPRPNFEKDAEFIKHLYSYAEPNKMVDPTPDIDRLVLEYKAVADEEKAITKKKDAIKAELLTLVGDAEKCAGKTYTISAGVVSEAEITYTRKAYRNFRISYKKGPKDE